MLVSALCLLELHFELVLKNIFVLVTHPLFISLLINLSVKIMHHSFSFSRLFLGFIGLWFKICISFLCSRFSDTLLGDHLKVLRNDLISILHLLMLCQKVANVALVKVTKITTLLDHLSKAFDNEVNELGVVVGHVILFYDDVLGQVNMDFHILDKEFNLG